MRLNLSSGNIIFLALAALAAGLAGCSRGSVGALNVERLGYSFSIDPPQKLLAIGNEWTFTASGGNAPYLYTIENGGGRIDPETGKYVAPAVPGAATIWVADATGRAATATVIINPALSLLAPVTSVDVSGSVLFTATGGVPPYSFAVVAGGGAIDPQYGSYTAPAAEGTATIRVIDSLGNQSETTLLIEDIIPPPTVTSFSPAAGPLGGGTTVTISGTDFQPGATVIIGTSSCNVTSESATTITCTTVATPAGTYGVVVTNPDGLSAMAASGFTFQPAPSVTAVSPLVGPSSGGTVITVTGGDFLAGAVVKVGTIACGNVTVLSASQLKCTTSAAVAGTYAVTVRNADGQQSSKSDAFTYEPAPLVSAVLPNAGPLEGGTALTVTGDHFVSGATVKVGAVDCGSVAFDSSTQLRCLTGANGSGTYAVTVTNPDGQQGSKSSLFTHQAAPSVTEVSPSAGALAGGTVLTIKGTNFRSGATVRVGTVACDGVSLNVGTQQLSCTTTASLAGTYTVTVRNLDGQEGEKAAAFTYQAGPSVSGVSPPAGALAGGTLLTITGTDFRAGATVKVGGVDCGSVAIDSSAQLRCTTQAAAAGTYTVFVKNTDGQQGYLGAAFTYQSAPKVSAVSPAAGALAGGTALTITGLEFRLGATVQVGTVDCLNVLFDSSTQLRCMTGPNPQGTYAVTVTNPDGQKGTTGSLFTHQPAPTIDSVSPNAGALAGSTLVTITGSGFQSSPTVKLGGTLCDLKSVLGGLITCATPAKTQGTYDVVVTNSDGQFATKVGGYTYQPSPTVTSVLPPAGPLEGGTVLTIRGTGFLSDALVKVGEVDCGSVSVDGPTQIRCTTAAGPSGSYEVFVINRDEQVGTKPAAFTYQAAPQVLNVSPPAGALAGGTVLTISGTGFISSGLAVRVGATPCTSIIYDSSTQVRCTTGANLEGTYAVTVINGDLQEGVKSSAFTHQAGPTVTGITPVFGPVAGETAVTISGTSFRDGVTVKIGGVACAVTSFNATSVQCTTGGNTAGLYDIEVKNTDNQTALLTGAFTYRGPPTITGVSPASGSILGGTSITITGTGFYAGFEVKVGDVSCADATLTGTTQIQCNTGAHDAGSVAIYVRNSDGQSVTSGAIYTYQAGPTVTQVSPASGSTAGGTTLTITGSGFAEGAQVMLGASDCNMVSVSSSTQLTCVAPSHAAGSVDVAVINPDSGSDTKVNGFAFFAPSQYRLGTHTTSSDSAGTLTDDGGPSGNYSTNNSYGFVIDGGGRPITLTFSSFRTEEDYDFVQVYDGNSTSGSPLHPASGFTGSALPVSVTANSGNMFIKLISGSGGTDQGFVASWVTAPLGSPVGNFVLSDASPSVDQPITFIDSSTNGPQSWAWDFNSDGVIDSTAQSPVYAFVAPGRNVISLTVANAAGASTVQRSVWVSTYSMTAVPSVTDRAGVLFDSGGANGNYLNGANHSFLIAPGLGPIRLDLKDLNLSAFDYLKIYDGSDSNTGVPLHTGSGFAGRGLPGSLWALSGKAYIVFTSDGGENRSGFELEWSAAPGGGPAARFSYGPAVPDVSQIVTFTDSSTGSPTAWEWDFENDGSVESWDRNPTHAYPTIGEKEVRLTVWNANGSSSIVRKINVATYTMCSSAAEMTALHAAGMVYDPGGSTRDYMENKTCGLLIQPQGGAATITLSFSSFILEPGGWDYVEVYDGTDTLGTVLTASTGTAKPAPVTAYSGSMYILFHSDAGTNMPGFAATWTSTPPP